MSVRGSGILLTPVRRLASGVAPTGSGAFNDAVTRAEGVTRLRHPRHCEEVRARVAEHSERPRMSRPSIREYETHGAA